MDKITSKSSMRPELSAVYLTPEKMVATDSFRLIEVKKPIGINKPFLFKAKGFKGRGAVSVNGDIINDDGKLIQGERVDGEYPDYEKALPTDKPAFTMYLNAKYLAEIAAEVDAHAKDPFHTIRLDFYDKHRPLVITAEGVTGESNIEDRSPIKVRGVIMPMNK